MQNTSSQLLIMAHKVLRDYYFDNYDEYFSLNADEKQKLFNELAIASAKHCNEKLMLQTMPSDRKWNITSHVFTQDDNVGFFENSEIHIIEMPTPTNKAEPYFIALGIAAPPDVYSTILPFYMIFEYLDEKSALYSEYKNEEQDSFIYISSESPLDPTINNFRRIIEKRISKVVLEITIPEQTNSDGETISFNVYQLQDRVLELEGFAAYKAVF